MGRGTFLDEEGGQTIANWNRGTHMEGEKEGDVCAIVLSERQEKASVTKHPRIGAGEQEDRLTGSH